MMFTLLGAMGLVFIAVGTMIKNVWYEKMLFILGGVLLEVYSIHIGDYIFIILQLVFIVASIIAFARYHGMRLTRIPKSHS